MNYYFRIKKFLMFVFSIASFNCFIRIDADSIKLFNKSNESLWVYVKKLGPANVDWSAKDTITTLLPNQSLNETGRISGLWVLPVRSINKRENSEELRKKAEERNLYQVLGRTKWPRVMSFSIADDGKEYLYFGKGALSDSFSFLNTSDIHPIGSSESAIKTMNVFHYMSHNPNRSLRARVNEARAKILKDLQKRRKFIGYMGKLIRRPENNVKAVILPGDNAGGYGNKPEVDAFLKTVYNPLQQLLNPRGGFIFVGMGNHDTYWTSFFLPEAPMLKWIKKTYGGYIYAFNIGIVRFINLGLFPTNDVQRTKLKWRGANSLGFLRSELKRLSKEQPVVIFFHYPIHDDWSDWWSKKEKDDFYQAIKDYNIIAILVGHSHTSRLWTFRDKFKVILSAYPEFTELKFNPAKPNDLGVIFYNKEGKPYNRETRTTGKEKDISDRRLKER